MSQAPLPLGSVAKRFGVTQRQVRRLFERGLLPEPPRVGAYRVISEDELPQVEEALRRAGYLKTEAVLALRLWPGRTVVRPVSIPSRLADPGGVAHDRW